MFLATSRMTAEESSILTKLPNNGPTDRPPDQQIDRQSDLLSCVANDLNSQANATTEAAATY